MVSEMFERAHEHVAGIPLCVGNERLVNAISASDI